MSTKYSLKLHENPLYHEIQFPNYIKITSSKRSKPIEDQESFRSINTQITVPCSRCFADQATITCSQCRNQIFCNKCDARLHRKGKFFFHSRDCIKQPSIKLDCQERTPPNQTPRQERYMEDHFKKSVILMINQTWETYSSEISQKFRTTIDSLKDKKKEILEKLQLKRTQELAQLETSWAIESEPSIGKPSTNNVSIVKSNSKVQSLCSEDMELKIDRKYKISLQVLEEINNLTQKIDIKTILIRNYDDISLQSPKKPARRSLGLTPCEFSASPTTRTPCNKKGLYSQSQSIIEAGPIQYQLFKLFPEGKMEPPRSPKGFQSSKLLSKVKSDKVVGKWPSQKTINNKDKSGIKKVAKQIQ